MEGTNYITIRYNFLQIAINAIGEIKKQGNKTTLLLKDGLISDEAWSKYDELTKWNDTNIVIPVLFNFFHGSELILKGLILCCGGELERSNHKFLIY